MKITAGELRMLITELAIIISLAFAPLMIFWGMVWQNNSVLLMGIVWLYTALIVGKTPSKPEGK